MKREQVHYTQCLADTLGALDRGGLLLASTKSTGESNVMTIGWGTVGRIWGKTIFVVLVRPSRYTYEFIEESGEFTVNVPPAGNKEWTRVCGVNSGRDMDKFAELGLTTTPGQDVGSVTIDGCPIVYECKVVHTNDVIPENLDESITSYVRGDYHRVYYGEILGVYAAE